MNHQLSEADVIILLGSHDLRVADRAVELYKQNYAPIVVFSGNTGVGTQGWHQPEAELFAARAVELGVPPIAILQETKATNTGENIRFTQQLLREHGIKARRILLVQKPYMERRSYATFMKQWEMNEDQIDVRVTSPQVTFQQYCSGDIAMETVIDLMVGDLQRIREYPKLGFQIAQEIPDDVWSASQELAALGFDRHALKSLSQS